MPNLLSQIEDQLQLSISNMEFYFSMLEDMDDATLMTKVKQYIKSAKVPLLQLKILKEDIEAFQPTIEPASKQYVHVSDLITNAIKVAKPVMDQKDVSVSSSGKYIDTLRFKAQKKLASQLFLHVVYMMTKYANGYETIEFKATLDKNKSPVVFCYIQNRKLDPLIGTLSYKSIKYLAKRMGGRVSLQQGKQFQALRIDVKNYWVQDS